MESMRNRNSRRGILAALGALTPDVSLFALMGAGAAGAAGAATIGPDSFGYTATSTSESLRTLSGGALTLSVGDDQVQSVPIGFPFSFYGTSYNDAYVSSNGFLSFDPGVSQGCCSGNTLPQPDAMNNAISAFWTDVCPGTGYSTSYCYGTIRTETIGTTPNREFVADYDIVSYCCSISGPRLKFQIILHETTNVIQLQYGQLDLDPYSRTQAAGIECTGAYLAAFFVVQLGDEFTRVLARFGLRVAHDHVYPQPVVQHTTVMGCKRMHIAHALRQYLAGFRPHQVHITVRTTQLQRRRAVAAKVQQRPTVLLVRPYRVSR